MESWWRERGEVMDVVWEVGEAVGWEDAGLLGEGEDGRAMIRRIGACAFWRDSIKACGRAGSLRLRRGVVVRWIVDSLSAAFRVRCGPPRQCGMCG